MQVTSSYGAEIKKQNLPVRHTLRIYRAAVGYLIRVYAECWDELLQINNTKKRFNAAEHLVHETKKNQAVYEFDLHFPKMPSYLRRSAIQHALGSVASYETRLSLWKSGKLTGKPKLVCENHAMPVFYRDVMYREEGDSEDAAYLKLYDGHDWKWFRVQLLHTDMEYLRKKWAGKKASAPTLEKRHDRYFLRFSYTEEITLSKTEPKKQTICSVDLGINTDAVCTIMRADGTVLGRTFINFASEKDRLYRVLGRIRRFQREHGSRQVQSRWAYAKRLNTELARRIAAAVTACAVKYGADVIVFEYLETRGRISGSRKQKLHLWKKREIQKRCEHQGHRNGIRVSRVSARNTSRLAYDGSGAVIRNPENHSLCTFRTGKQYNCDLSAAYNIGARYFIRELLKPFSETERSSLEAKVPSVKRRTSCVYADLRQLWSELELCRTA